MIEILQQYLPNMYLRALVVLIVLLIIIRILIFVVQRVTLKLVSKTKTDLDDIIMQRTSKPITSIAFLISFRIALNELVLEQFVQLIVSRIIYSFIVIVLGYSVYVVIDIVAIRGWRKLSKKTKTDIDDSLVSLVHSSLKVAMIVLAFLYILNVWGVEIGPFLAGLGIAGIGVALALQPTLSNIFSGISMILDKSIRVGDLVYLDSETKGKIVRVGLRSTRINTFDNELVIVPNSKLADSKIQNVAMPEPKSRVVIPFGVAYGSNIEKVKKIVLKEIKTIKHIEKDPEPTVKFLEMADSSLNFKAYFYVDSYENRFNAIDEANTKIYNALNKNKIEIPFPQIDVNLKK